MNNKSRLAISNFSFGVVSVLATFAINGFVLMFLFMQATSGQMSEAHAEATQQILAAIAVILVLAVVGVTIFWASAKALFWIELGDEITYHRLIGVGSLQWSDVSHVARESEFSLSALERRVFGFGGKLTLTLTNGDTLTIRIPSEQCEEARAFMASAARPLGVRSARWPWWGCVGCMALGAIVLAMGACADYLIITGSWAKSFVATAPTTKGRLLMISLPFLLPPLGIMIFAYGLYQLLRKPPQQ